MSAPLNHWYWLIQWEFDSMLDYLETVRTFLEEQSRSFQEKGDHRCRVSRRCDEHCRRRGSLDRTA